MDFTDSMIKIYIGLDSSGQDFIYKLKGIYRRHCKSPSVKRTIHKTYNSQPF